MAFESEEDRLFHNACRDGRTRDAEQLFKSHRHVLDPRSVVTGRTVSVESGRGFDVALFSYSREIHARSC